MLEIMVCAMLTVLDGDTVRCDGQLLRILGDGAPYVDGVDTPEVWGSDCQAELMLARLATNRLEELINTPGVRIEDSGQIDPHDRPLVTIRMPDGRAAGQILIDEGLAVEWTPEYEANWCG